MGESNDHVGHRCVDAINPNCAGEGFIDLQYVRTQLFQPGKGAVACAEIIDSQLHPFEMKMLGHMVVAILKYVAFGELHHQLLYRMGAEPVVMQIAQQFAVGEMAGGDVDADVKMFVLRKKS